jgi:hypothetical protein
MTVIAGFEGALVLARARQSVAPLICVGEVLTDLLEPPA